MRLVDLRFAGWQLEPIPEAPARYYGKCRSCGERSPHAALVGQGQLWCLRHTDATGHAEYEIFESQEFNATVPADSTPATT
ncbi:DUF7848 domain-containing protein [Streptomyces sp. NBC_01356]|uniref:DUF7848 domain-containing protein n=1 Tax=Streptomyces sp. NBC_01356 TaxID=2903836 RepID=UPI003FCD7D91